jgi:hypothetical protein
MTDPGGLDHALDLLCADMSPRHAVPGLSPVEVSMLIVAQRLRGTIPPPPSPQFIAGLLAILFPDPETRSRAAWLSSAEAGSE